MPAYFILALIWCFTWLIVFILRKDEHRKIMIMSWAVILFSFFDYYSRPGYWHPPTFFSLPVGIEDILFGFSFGGVASAIIRSNKNAGPVRPSVVIKNLVFLSPVLIVSVGLNVLFNVNIMICLPVGLFTGCLLIMIIRTDLIKRLLYSALYFGLLYFLILLFWFMIFPQAHEWWNLNIYRNISILSVPFGEVLFGFLFGGFWGSVYEFIFSNRQGNINKPITHKKIS